MSGSSLWDLQEGIFTILDGDANLGVLTNGVYDGEVPPEEDVRCPYVRLGEWNETPDNLHTRIGRQVTVAIHVYSDYRGFKEAKLIGNRIIQLLEHQPISGTDWRIISCQFENAQTIMDPEQIRHNILVFRLRTGPIA
jgi:hypothetical protein